MGYSTDAPKGDKGDTGDTGPAGATGSVGPGVASGGLIHQVLTKTSSTDYATDWEDPAAGVFPGTVTSQTAYSGTATDGVSALYSRTDHLHGTVQHELPTGGTLNQVLAKNTTTDYGVTWATPAAGTTWEAATFGDGADSAITFDGTSTILGMSPTSSTYRLTQDIFATTVVINSGVIVRPDQYRIFATVSINNSGTIQSDGLVGTNGTNSTGGVAGTSSDYSTGNNQSPLGRWASVQTGAGGANAAAGGAGTVGAAATGWGTGGLVPTNTGGVGGSGTDTGAASRAGGAGGGTVAALGKWRFRSFNDVVSHPPWGLSGVGPGIWHGWCGGGGAGLDSGAGGGGGGGPGGAIFLAAPSILNTGSIHANGGNGGNAFATRPGCGGGGGSGGVVCLVYNTMGTTGTIQAEPGSGGTNSNVISNTGNATLAHCNSTTDAALYTGSAQTPVVTAQFLVVHNSVAAGTAGTVTSITGTLGWNVTYTQVITMTYNSGLRRITVYRFTPSGANNGTITLNMSATQTGCSAHTISNSTWNATEASLVVQSTSTSGNSADPTATLTSPPVNSNPVLAIVADTTTSANVTAGAGYTEISEQNSGANGAGTVESAATSPSSANAQSATWTITSGQWGAVIIEVLSKLLYGTAAHAGVTGTIYNFTP